MSKIIRKIIFTFGCISLIIGGALLYFNPTQYSSVVCFFYSYYSFSSLDKDSINKRWLENVY